MKTILTLTFVLFFGATAMAQNTVTDIKVETIEMGVVLVGGVGENTFEISLETKEVAIIYKYKNTRVKKELVFTTKNNKAKLA